MKFWNAPNVSWPSSGTRLSRWRSRAANIRVATAVTASERSSARSIVQPRFFDGPLILARGSQYEVAHEGASGHLFVRDRPGEDQAFRVEDSTAIGEHACPLAQCRPAVTQMMGRVIREHRVERSIFERKWFVRIEYMELAARRVAIPCRSDRPGVIVDANHLGARLLREEGGDPTGATRHIEHGRHIGAEPRSELPRFGGLKPPGLAEILVIGLEPNLSLRIGIDRRECLLVEVGPAQGRTR